MAEQNKYKISLNVVISPDSKARFNKSIRDLERQVNKNPILLRVQFTTEEFLAEAKKAYKQQSVISEKTLRDSEAKRVKALEKAEQAAIKAQQREYNALNKKYESWLKQEENKETRLKAAADREAKRQEKERIRAEQNAKRAEEKNVRYLARKEQLEKAQAAAEKKRIEDLAIFQQRKINQLNRLKINKEDIFKDKDVTIKSSGETVNIGKEYKALLQDIQNLGTKGGKSFKQLSTDVDTFKTKTQQVAAQIRNTNKDGYSFVSMLEVAAKKIAIWAISTGFIYGALRQIKQGVQYIIDLDNAMNEVRIVTGYTQAKIEELKISYNKLAKEMSVTTIEIAKTSAELYRQGLTTAEVEKRMKSIIQYAKISSLSLDESSKIITATVNATGQSVEKVIDIFSLLGRFCSAA